MSGSAAKGSYSLSITATDSASKQLDGINKRLQAVQAPVLRMNRTLNRLGENLGVTRLGRSIGDVGQQAGDAFRQLSRLSAPVEALAGAASLAGLAKLTTNFADLGQQLTFAGQRAGLTASQLQILENSGRLAGTSADAVAQGMQNLNDNFTNAAAGRAPEFVSLLGALNIHATNSAQALPQLADKIASITNPTLQATVATKAFGAAGESLLPWLRLGAKGIEENNKQAEHYGTLSDAAALRAIKLAVAQKQLKLSAEGLSNSVGDQLSPIMTKLTQHFSEFLVTQRRVVDSGGDGFFEKLSKAADDVDFNKIALTLEGIGSRVHSIVGYFGGWQTAAEGLAVFMTTSWVARMMMPLLQIGQTMFYLGMLSPAASGALGLGAAVGIATDKALNANGIAPNPTGDWPMVSPSGPISPDDMAKGVMGLPGMLYRSARDAIFGPSFDTKMSPEARGLLDTIAGPESHGDYSIRNGGSHIADFSKFPEGRGPGGSSSASGRYQFTAATWAEEKQRLSLPDFSPASQDKAGWDLAQRRYYDSTAGRYLSDDLKNAGDPAVRQMITSALKGTWPSMPGGSQQLIGQDKFDAALLTNTLSEQARPSAPPVNVVQPSGPPVNIAGGTGSAQAADPGLTVRGSAQLDINMRGAPPGTTTTASATGLFSPPKLNIQQAMPDYSHGY